VLSFPDTSLRSWNEYARTRAAPDSHCQRRLLGCSSITFFFYVAPAIAATAESGQEFVAHLVTQARITTAIAAAAVLTVLAGSWLYWIDSQGLTSPWQNSGPGVGFGFGGLFAFVGLIFGLLVGKNTSVLGHLAASIQGKPTPEQLSAIASARKQLASAGPIGNAAMIVAVLCMATARYWLF
jgi:hypothetical protein